MYGKKLEENNGIKIEKSIEWSDYLKRFIKN